MTGTTLPDRALLRLSGDDVRGFLQGLVTADTQGPLPRWAALLTPQGKALFDFILWADGADVLVDCERAQVDALARRLAMYRLRRAISIARDDTLAVHWSAAEPSGEASPDPRVTTLGWRWLAAPGDAAEGWRAHRLALGVTEGVGELGTGETLWLECNAAELAGVDFTKGCYVGQENTARMHYRAKVNRRLVVVPLGEPNDRTRATYPELGLAVEHRRVDALGNAIVPEWLASALAAAPDPIPNP
ncbi:YgfZ/GcvT domain-containing protein [Sphingomonas sp.]|uniref:CAF17-like 4Fe-4S cluster assembly/insertion protein YgfZ n=1 Tax=Sphingomonas sp. TaxID=28214 RepID=UPI0035BC6129